MKNRLKTVEGFTQRNNDFSPSKACFPTSDAIALHYKGVKDPYDGLQLEDYLVKTAVELSKVTSYAIIGDNSTWKWYVDNDRGFQVIPIMEYICKKLYNKTQLSWAISFNDIMTHIDNDSPVVCLGNFSSISYVSGHYNCIIGYDSEKNTVITMDPFGNAHTNYSDSNGLNMEYDWSIFCQEGTLNSYGLLF